jgi:hypothetical protein
LKLFTNEKEKNNYLDCKFEIVLFVESIKISFQVFILILIIFFSSHVFLQFYSLFIENSKSSQFIENSKSSRHQKATTMHFTLIENENILFIYF